MTLVWFELEFECSTTLEYSMQSEKKTKEWWDKAAKGRDIYMFIQIMIRNQDNDGVYVTCK